MELKKKIVNRTRHMVRLIDITGRVIEEFDTDGPPIRVGISTEASDLVEGLPMIRNVVNYSPDQAVIEASDWGEHIVIVSRMVLDVLTDPMALAVAIAPDTGHLSRVLDRNGNIDGVMRFITRAVPDIGPATDDEYMQAAA